MSINIKTPFLATLTLVTTETAKTLNDSTLTTPVPKIEVVDNKTNSTEQHSKYFFQGKPNQTVLANNKIQSLFQVETPSRFAALFGANLTLGTDISHLIHTPQLGTKSVIQLDSINVHIQEHDGKKVIAGLTVPCESIVQSKRELEQMLEDSFPTLKEIRVKHSDFHFHHSILKTAQKMLSMKKEGQVANVDMNFIKNVSTYIRGCSQIS